MFILRSKYHYLEMFIDHYRGRLSEDNLSVGPFNYLSKTLWELEQSLLTIQN